MSNPIEAHQEIVRGDTYKAAEGRALTWASSDWPNIAGSSLTMTVGHLDPNIPAIAASPSIKWTGSVPAGPAIWVATIELTATQTAEPPEGCLDYTLAATLPDGDVVTLAIGQLTVLTQPGSEGVQLPSP